MRIPELVALMTNPLLGFTGGATYTPAAALGGSSQGGSDTLSALFAPAQANAGVSSRGPDQVELSGEGGSDGQTTGGGALLDQYIRKRAVVSFSVPQLGSRLGGGAANFTFEIETAYRLISPVEPGYLTDESA